MMIRCSLCKESVEDHKHRMSLFGAALVGGWPLCEQCWGVLLESLDSPHPQVVTGRSALQHERDAGRSVLARIGDAVRVWRAARPSHRLAVRSMVEELRHHENVNLRIAAVVAVRILELTGEP